jgi:hypothetical protein
VGGEDRQRVIEVMMHVNVEPDVNANANVATICHGRRA